MRSSLVPAMNTRPPAVTIEPPNVSVPVRGIPRAVSSDVFAERDLPGEFARVQVDRVERSPGRLDRGVALVVEELNVAGVPEAARSSAWSPPVGFDERDDIRNVVRVDIE